MADHEAKTGQRRTTPRAASARSELDGLNLPEEYEPCVLDEIALGFERKVKALEEKLIDLLQGDKTEDGLDAAPAGPTIKRKRKRKLADGTEIEEDVEIIDPSTTKPSRAEMLLEHEREVAAADTADFGTALNLPKRQKPGKPTRIKKGLAPRYGNPSFEEDK